MGGAEVIPVQAISGLGQVLEACEGAVRHAAVMPSKGAVWSIGRRSIWSVVQGW